MKRLSPWVLLACVAFGFAPVARGQGQDMLDFGLGGAFGSAEPVEIDARFQLMQGSPQGYLWIKARIMDDWHIYSDKQPSGGPIATEFSLVANDVLEVTGPFEADRDAEIHNYPEAFPGVPCHEYRGEVIWRTPVQLKDGADPASGELKVRVEGQACKDDLGGLGACQILELEAPLTYVAEPFLPVQGETKYRSKIAPEIEWSAQTDVASVAPGGKVKLTFTAKLEPGWHVYEWQPKRAESTGNMPTLIVFSKLSGMTVEQTTPDRKPLPAKSAEELPNYEKSISWTVEMNVPADAATEGNLQLAGLLGYQICTESKCQPPSGARFELTLPLASVAAKGKVDATFADSSYTKANDLAKQQAEAKAGGGPGDGSEEVEPLTLINLAGVLGLGLLGGFILNAMPCVLPVIGLKILSFVEQAGQSRTRVFLLNLYFSLGLMAVFMILATLAAFANMAWGELFTKPWFKITMSATVFVMALSFLGVWEIQIPGMVGGKASHELQQKEGFAGAFFKGVFTTLLATPCSGPFLGALFALAVKYPPAITYLVFGSIGLGMALPYLAIGANPNLVARPSQARRLDGDLQAAHGLRLVGDRRVSLLHAPQLGLCADVRPVGRALVRVLADRPRSSDRRVADGAAHLGLRWRRRGVVWLSGDGAVWPAG